MLYLDHEQFKIEYNITKTVHILERNNHFGVIYRWYDYDEARPYDIIASFPSTQTSVNDAIVRYLSTWHYRHSLF